MAIARCLFARLNVVDNCVYYGWVLCISVRRFETIGVGRDHYVEYLQQHVIKHKTFPEVFAICTVTVFLLLMFYYY